MWIVCRTGSVDRCVHLVVVWVIRGWRNVITVTVLGVAHSGVPTTDVTPPVEVLRTLTVLRIEDDVLVTVIRTFPWIQSPDLATAVDAHELVLFQVAITAGSLAF